MPNTVVRTAGRVWNVRDTGLGGPKGDQMRSACPSVGSRYRSALRWLSAERKQKQQLRSTDPFGNRSALLLRWKLVRLFEEVIQ